MKYFLSAAILAGSVLAGSMGAALAQTPPPAAAAPGFERIPLQTTEWPPGYNSTSMTVKFKPAGGVPRHTHPGIESGYLAEGELTIKQDGKPDMAMKAGGSWVIPADTVHAAVAGAGGATAIVTYVVDKTKPISAPAP